MGLGFSFMKKGENVEGWICPKCGKALAPWVRECDCPPLTKTVTTYLPWPEYPINPWPSTGDPLPPPAITICEG